MTTSHRTATPLRAGNEIKPYGGDIEKIPAFLRGYALDCYQALTNDERNDYYALKRAFKKEIYTDVGPRVFVAALAQRRQGNGESVTDFVSALVDLGSRAFPEVNEATRDQILVNQRSQNISNPQTF